MRRVSDRSRALLLKEINRIRSIPFEVISEENEVIIPNVTRHTHRRYECVASNGYPPDVARSFQFIIQYPPEVHLFVNDQLATTNIFSERYPNDLYLKCQVQANPVEKILWLKDGRPLPSHAHTYQIGHAAISELPIRLFTDQDQGEYTCLTSNALGSSSKSIQLLALSTTSPTTKPSRTLTTTVQPGRITSRRKRPKYARITTMVSTGDQATESVRMMSISSKGNATIDDDDERRALISCRTSNRTFLPRFLLHPDHRRSLIGVHLVAH